LTASSPGCGQNCIAIARRDVGSVIDGEDVLQDALIKAVESLASAARRQPGRLAVPDRAQHRAGFPAPAATASKRFESAEEVDMIADEADTVASRQIASASLRTFMRLPVAQRASVILMDVLGCSLQEICAVMDFSLPAVKAALHRGRAQLRELADEPEDRPQPKIVGRRSRSPRRLCRALQRARFRRDPRHDRGRCTPRPRQQDPHERQAEVSRYFGNYSKVGDWHLCPGWSKDGPPSWCFDPNDPGSGPKYFMLLQWSPTRSLSIPISATRPTVIDGAEYLVTSVKGERR